MLTVIRMQNELHKRRGCGSAFANNIKKQRRENFSTLINPKSCPYNVCKLNNVLGNSNFCF
ncbi:hypothetical protein WN55_03092 [Dufourea novaeangliae]|uniref:Uncharacterized protein n=1 Tax=Dufourea novaeangliae TaxID=178035 RepID=A0A154PI36_DUFNO|nr:hypothetical protein WN55_03092 [Dufourea novaeangliae]